MSNPVDDLGNVQVDFVWGNMPMQPDDQRGMATLDPALDNHIIATTMYNGFPGYTPVPPFDDTVPNRTVPNVVGLTESAATTALTNVNLVKGIVTETEVGATTSNDGKIKSQAPTSGTVVNSGDEVDLVKYLTPVVPDVVGMTEAEAVLALEAAFLAEGATPSDYVGATVENDLTVKSSNPVAGTKRNTGATVDLTLYVAPTVPDVLGLGETAAGNALVAAHLVKGTVTTSADGATAENDGLVKSQTPVSGGKADTGSAVDLVLYAFAG